MGPFRRRRAGERAVQRNVHGPGQGPDRLRRHGRQRTADALALDVAKHVNMANLGPYFAGWEWAMNRAKWNKLSDKERRILLDTIAEWTVETELAYIAAGEQAIKEAPNHGVTVYQPSPEINKSIEDFASHARAMAIKEGKERFKLKDPEGLVSR